jgi:hypothetical protein
MVVRLSNTNLVDAVARGPRIGAISGSTEAGLTRPSMGQNLVRSGEALGSNVWISALTHTGPAYYVRRSVHGPPNLGGRGVGGYP